MPTDLTPEQITRLQTLGIIPGNSQPVNNTLVEQKTPVSVIAEKPIYLPTKPQKSSIFPLLSISGLTLLSFGGLILFKSHDSSPSNQAKSPVNNQPAVSSTQISPTQVPKSIQHYLLTSQQYFSQALQLQQPGTQSDPTTKEQQTVGYLNQSILAATQAIKEFPQDYRGYFQRGRIYESLMDSKTEFVDQALADFFQAYQLKSDYSDITRSLAAIYARKNDFNNTVAFLTKTIAIDPTKAQNFYDLAKIEQDSGMIPEAIETYNRLLPLLTDPVQKTKVEEEKKALENLALQNPDSKLTQPLSPNTPITPPNIQLPENPPTLQASNTSDQGLIIASPEEDKKIAMQSSSSSNALSGSTILPANQKEITITNFNFIPESNQVYLTIVRGGKNQTLQVLSKSENSFTVGLNSPIPEDIEFKWWIIK